MSPFLKTSKRVSPYQLYFAFVSVGIVAGLGAVGFYILLEACVAFNFGYLANYFPLSPSNEQPLFTSEINSGNPLRWVLLVLPVVGGLITGSIAFWLAPEVEGHGTDAAINTYHFRDGKVRSRVPLLKAVTSAITIGTGGSGGREGPIAQIGSGFGSILAGFLKMPPHLHRSLMAAGMAGGIGAIFHAPLAGAIFAAEVMYKGPDLEAEVLFPSFITCIVAYCVFGTAFGFHPLFVTPNYHFSEPLLLLPYFLLAVVSAIGAMAYVRAFYGVRRLMFGRIALPNHFKPAIGGLATGLIGFFIPEALGTGYGVLQACFDMDAGNSSSFNSFISYRQTEMLISGLSHNPSIVVAILLLLTAIAKIWTTAFSIGSGGSGGVFGPAVVIGGALGGSVGLICREVFPSLSISPGAFALVGMAGFFAGAANTPISTIVMVSEMTGNYNLLLPAMFVCLITYGLCRHYTLYEEQIPTYFEAPIKLGKMARAIFARVTVAETLAVQPNSAPPIVPENMSAEEMVKKYADSEFSYFPVIDSSGYPKGIIEVSNIHELEDLIETSAPIVAKDISIRTPFVLDSESLLSVVNLIAEKEVPELPVVSEPESKKVIGMIGEKEIIIAYNKWVSESEIS